MLIKFCGNRRIEDAGLLNVCKPDYMGMILSPGFRRSVDLETAARITARLDPAIQTVGVLVNETIADALRYARAACVEILQLHGQEDAGYLAALREVWNGPIWKAVRVQTEADIVAADALGADLLVVEGYVPGRIGGTGQTADWQVIAKMPPKTPWLLAGGLHPGNVLDALQEVSSKGVDISSGIETDGVKDAAKMQQIIRIIRGEQK